MAVRMIEKEHARTVKATREDLILIARSIVKHAESPNDFDQQIKRLEKALDAYKAAESFIYTVESLRKQVDTNGEFIAPK